MEEKTAQPITPAETNEKVATPVVPAQENVGMMPRRTLVLILLLVVVTIGLLAIALIIPNVKSPLIPKPAPAALNYLQTKLSFSTPISLGVNSYSSDVIIFSGSNKITAVQLEIAYDPKVLTNVDIKPGTFLTSPVVLLKKIDTVNGRVSYALGINPSQKPTSGSGTVAILTFSTLPGITATQTAINFDPKTDATAVGYAQPVLKQTTGVLFQFGPTPTP
jgi:hypothetical protein